MILRELDIVDPRRMINFLDFTYGFGYSEKFLLDEAVSFSSNILRKFLGPKSYEIIENIIAVNLDIEVPDPTIYTAFHCSDGMPVRMIPIQLNPRLTRVDMSRFPHDSQMWSYGANIIRMSGEVLNYGLEIP